jgi:nucleoside-diphosphate-sugar epimerase
MDKSPIIYGDGSQKRSFNFSSDTARGTADALISDKSNNAILNIGNSEEPISLIDLGKKIIKIAGKEDSLEVEIKNSFKDTDRDSKREIFQRYCNTDLAKSMIGYQSKISLDEGIKIIIETGSFEDTWPSSEKKYLID